MVTSVPLNAKSFEPLLRNKDSKCRPNMDSTITQMVSPIVLQKLQWEVQSKDVESISSAIDFDL